MRGDSESDTELLTNMADEAKAFTEAFDWCRGIKDGYFGCGIGGVVGVFFFRIIPACHWCARRTRWTMIMFGDRPTHPAKLQRDKRELRERLEAEESQDV